MTGRHALTHSLFSSVGAPMAELDAGGNANEGASGWMVEIVGGGDFPRGTYSMVGIDSLRCALERSGGPSFEMSAEDVVRYEKAGLFRITGPEASNDNV